jgi:hypothetical protein
VRRLEVQLVGPECDALAADQLAHRDDDARVVDEAVEGRVEVVERLDYAQRRRARPVLDLHGDAIGVHVAVAVDLVGAPVAGQVGRDAAHALGGGAQRLELVRREDRAAHEEAVLAPGAPLAVGQPERDRVHAAIRANARSTSARSSS